MTRYVVECIIREGRTVNHGDGDTAMENPFALTSSERRAQYAREYERAVRLWSRIQATPRTQRDKKYTKRWPAVINDVWYFAEEAGIEQSEVSRRLREFDVQLTCSDLTPAGPW